ncbi:hypothetical protein KT99_04822 [Shewanella benthica KT99]|uniref:Uncharacterized protein n=1 Tax=Shewanella benthica KT99 TaxID=314608 RepID=A9DD92_9GAMM|nr:hypothetical protein KT99_04822 [Shewanella benthica KT99]
MVAAQQHLAEVTTFIGIDKHKSYKLGQRHVSGISLVVPFIKQIAERGFIMLEAITGRIFCLSQHAALI